MKFNLYPAATQVNPNDTVLIWDQANSLVKQASKNQLLVTVESLQDLRDLSVTGLSDGASANVAGYASVDDGGGGVFIYDSGSAAADNDGTILQPTVGTGRWLRLYSGPINVKWFGATGDGVTDDETALLAAVAYAESLVNLSNAYRPALYFPPGPGFLTTGTITVGPGVDILMDSRLLYSANSGTALVIGEAANPNVNGNFRINVFKSSLSTWADGTIGVVFINTYSSTIDIVEVAQFQYGIWCVGDTAGFVYNSVTLGAIRNNKVGLTLTTGAGVGWCNENNFFGGRFDVSSTTNTTTSRNAVVITSGNVTYNNNNNFYKPSFELSNSTLGGGATSVPILIEYGEINAFYNIRMEDCGTLLATVSNDSYRNVFEMGYGPGVWGTNVNDAGTYRDSVVISRDTRRPDTIDLTTVFNSGPLHKLAVPYSATEVMVPKCHFGSTSSVFAWARMSSININAESLGVAQTRFVGIFISTEVQKRFIVRRDFASASNPGRVAIRAYDSTGAVLGTGHVFGSAGYNWTYNAGYAGGAYFAAESAQDIFFAVSSSVKKVAVLVGDPSSGYTLLRSFSVDSIDGGSPAAWAGVNEGSLVQNEDGLPRASASPTIFANECPQFIFHSAPATATEMGWVKVFSLATTTVGVESGSPMTVASAAGVAASDIVTVLLDNGTYHHTTVSGVVGADVSLTAGLPSNATNAPVYFARYVAMANLA